jgi:predicted nuclease of predicted toxin-antitoxin system
MIALLIDENLNQRILRGLQRVVPHMDFVIAQAAGLRRVEDPPLLEAAAAQKRIVLTHDLKTIPKFAYEG